jgi:hypothetical protein
MRLVPLWQKMLKQNALSEMDATTLGCWNSDPNNISISKEPDGQLSITILELTVYS